MESVRLTGNKVKSLAHRKSQGMLLRDINRLNGLDQLLHRRLKRIEEAKRLTTDLVTGI